MKNVIFIGPPGVGKGTFSKLVSQRLNLKHISLGDIVRTEISRGTLLGKEIQDKYVGKGLLLPDHVATTLAATEVKRVYDGNRKTLCISSKHYNGIILDGYPRTTSQAEALSILIHSYAGAGDEFSAVNIVLEDWVAIKKILGRVKCTKCNRDFNETDVLIDGYDMPAILPTPQSCPSTKDVAGEGFCGGKYLRRTRSDDTDIKTIRTRFCEYELKTSPVLEYYRARDRLKVLQVKRGIKDIDDLLQLII